MIKSVGIWRQVFLVYPEAGLNPLIFGFVPMRMLKEGDRAKAWTQSKHP
jgi:hypothetical protein